VDADWLACEEFADSGGLFAYRVPRFERCMLAKGYTIREKR
jgi:hypothetical protein